MTKFVQLTAALFFVVGLALGALATCWDLASPVLAKKQVVKSTTDEKTGVQTDHVKTKYASVDNGQGICGVVGMGCVAIGLTLGLWSDKKSKETTS